MGRKRKFKADDTSDINIRSSPSRDSATGLEVPKLPASHLTFLKDKCVVSLVQVSAGSSITKNITRLLAELQTADRENQKPKLVILVADGKSAGKLTSIVEITKRDLQSKKFRWFQYTGMSVGEEVAKLKEEFGYKANRSESDDRDRKKKSGDPGLVNDAKKVERSHEAEDDDDGEEEEEEAFERIPQLNLELQKEKPVVYLTICLSQVPVPALREMYTQQCYETNDVLRDLNSPSD
ncbi:hypothetical protein M501DRAFT_1014682 [Patellaria atrata CBS 101060]|uniref:DNA/RNA-binding protein Alba-like domain-containing protein n=1 Tax=Patellaria atrata CBS 101060 TaxID=1346257 RepID=A0A9P4SDD9_9PEZI|nr:hypothetical protein M501DRAFT_1014682 [Patellaria atrata CBS 101060]